MAVAQPPPAVPPCPACGADLPGKLGERWTICVYCGARALNAQCLPPGTEVMVPEGSRFDLSHIVRCGGPDDLAVRGGKVWRLEELTAVTAVDADLRSRTPVFYRGVIGWAPTYTASDAEAGRVRVKDPKGGYEDPFFDETTQLANVRIAVSPQLRQRRSWLRTQLVRLQSDPLYTVFHLAWVGAILAFGAFMLWLFGGFLMAVVRG